MYELPLLLFGDYLMTDSVIKINCYWLTSELRSICRPIVIGTHCGFVRSNLAFYLKLGNCEHFDALIWFIRAYVSIVCVIVVCVD